MLQICIYVLANSNIVTLRIYQAYFSKSSSSYFISLIARILLHFMSVLLESSHLCMQKRGRTIQGDDIFIVISIYFYCTQKIFNKFKFGVANRLSSPSYISINVPGTAYRTAGLFSHAHGTDLPCGPTPIWLKE